ncbi:MAG: hypothetical protein ACM3X9_13890 [Bacillota bacterium]
MKLAARQTGKKKNGQKHQEELLYMSQYMALIIQKEKLNSLKLTG